jgi:type IV pilus assembly protein PilX
MARQEGAVLVVSLLLLLIMTLLALGASQSTKLQERMAGNQRDMELALQSAEAGLRKAEEVLAPGHILVICSTAGPACEAYRRNTLPANMTRNTDAWWDLWGRDYVEAMGVAKQPEYVIEHLADSSDTLSRGGSYLTVIRDFNRATARSSGLTQTAQAVVQSTYSTMSFE